MTSIEWLIEKVLDNGIGLPKEWREQAKEMHKQEIIKSYRDGRSDQQSERPSKFYNRMSEQYYQETFVSKGSDFKQFSLYEHKDTITSSDTQVSKTFLEAEQQLPQQEICISCDEQKETHKICMDCIGKMIKENQQELSDEEIATFAMGYYNNNDADYYVTIGAKWYREQLKQRQ